VKIPCPAGSYGNRLGLSSASCSDLCSEGFYCPMGSVNGTFHRCPAGRYGATKGLYDSSCTNLCSAGYHCYEGSTSATQLQCGVVYESFIDNKEEWNRYQAMNGSVIPTNNHQFNLVPLLDSNGNPNHMRQVSLSQFPTVLLTNLLTSQIQFQLTEPNQVYCPLGTSIPLTVLPGYYTTGNNATTRSGQVICPMGSYCMNGKRYSCPGGRYGDQEGLFSANCTGICSRGFYCPAGSTSSRKFPCPIGKRTADFNSFVSFV
jgi:hypothetical protein